LFEQHWRQPRPGQHTVPLLQALWNSHLPFWQRPCSQGFIAGHWSSVLHSLTGVQPTSTTQTSPGGHCSGTGS
jgi:hypothetical protein